MKPEQLSTRINLASKAHCKMCEKLFDVGDLQFLLTDEKRYVLGCTACINNSTMPQGWRNLSAEFMDLVGKYDGLPNDEMLRQTDFKEVAELIRLHINETFTHRGQGKHRSAHTRMELLAGRRLFKH